MSCVSERHRTSNVNLKKTFQGAKRPRRFLLRSLLYFHFIQRDWRVGIYNDWNEAFDCPRKNESSVHTMYVCVCMYELKVIWRCSYHEYKFKFECLRKLNMIFIYKPGVCNFILILYKFLILPINFFHHRPRIEPW